MARTRTPSRSRSTLSLPPSPPPLAQYSKKFNILVYTLKHSLPNVVRFFITAFPIFFAFAVIGLVLFSEDCPKFSDLGTACVTLFAVLNGDEVCPPLPVWMRWQLGFSEWAGIMAALSGVGSMSEFGPP